MTTLTVSLASPDRDVARAILAFLQCNCKRGYTYNQVAAGIGLKDDWARVSRMLRRAVAKQGNIIAYKRPGVHGKNNVTLYMYSPARRLLDSLPQAEKTDQIARDIRAFLEQHQSSDISKRAIRLHLRELYGTVDNNRVDAALDLMIERGEVVTTVGIRRATYYVLADNALSEVNDIDSQGDALLV